MIIRIIKWFGIVSAAALALIILTVLVVAGTEDGTKFLADRAAPFLPEGLDIGEVQGTLIKSVRLSEVTWANESTSIEANRVEITFGFRYLLKLVLNVQEFRAEEVAITNRQDVISNNNAPPIQLDLPLTVNVANLELVDVQFKTGDFARRIESIKASGSLSGTTLDVLGLSVNADWLNASLNGELETQAPYQLWTDFEWVLNPDTAEAIAGSGMIDGNQNGYVVEHELAKPFAITTDGELNWQDSLVFNARNSWTELQVNLNNQNQIFSDRGQLDVRGSFDQFDFELDAQALFPQGIQAEIVADGMGNTEQLTVETLKLLTDSGRALVTGPINISASGLEWKTAIEIENLQLAQLAEELDGHVNFKGRSQGRFDQWETVAGSADIDSLTGDLFGRPLNGAGSISVADSTATLNKVVLQTGENRLDLDGQLGERLRLTAKIAADRLDYLMPDLAGRLSGTMSLSGSFESPVIQANLSGERLGFGGWTAENLTLVGRGSGPLDQQIELSARKAGLGETQADEIAITVQGGLPAHSIDLSGTLADNSINMRLQGAYESLVWSGAVESAVFQIGATERWTAAAPAVIRVDQTRQRLSPLCMEGVDSKRFCAEFESHLPDATQAIKVTLESFPLGSWIEAAEPQLLADGNLFADLSLERARGDYNGSIAGRVDRLELGLRQTPDQDAPDSASETELVNLALQFGGNINNNLLTLNVDTQVNGIDTGTGMLTIADIRDTNSPLQALVDITLADVGFLSWFSEQFTITGGALNANATLNGTITDPKLSGSLQVADANMLVAAAGVTFNNIQLNAIASDAKTIDFNAAAESGGGQLQVTGTTLADIDAGWPTELNIQGQDIELLRFPEWSVYASPDLSLSANADAAKLTGTILIPRAKFVLDTVPETAQSPSPDTVIHLADASAPAELYNYDIELTVTIGDDVKLEGFGLNANLAGELDLTGGLRRQFRGNGELALKDGKFNAYGQMLEIERGLILFTGALDNPLLDIRATRKIDNISVGILVSGPVDQPQSSLFSDPPMSEASALSYLVTGQPLPEAGEEEGDRISGAAIALGLSQANGIVSEVSNTLGLDEISIEGGSTDGRILAGKRLSNKLYLRYAYGVFDSIGSLLLRYRLNDRFVIESESGEQQSLDIVYSIDLD